MTAANGNPNVLRLAVAGAAGRMGRAVMELAAAQTDVAIVAALVRSGASCNGTLIQTENRDMRFTDRLETNCDVLIDFTAGGTDQWLSVCARRHTPIVIGATGLTSATLSSIHSAAAQIPIVLASNFSPGIQAVLRAITTLARALADGYDVEIVETHHRRKKDSPSGTANMLLDELRRSLPGGKGSTVAYGRVGDSLTRPLTQIGMHSVRMGDVVGQHEVHFSGFGETVTIRHTAHSRSTFAAGALRAARWLVNRPPGMYTLADVLPT